MIVRSRLYVFRLFVERLVEAEREEKKEDRGKGFSSGLLIRCMINSREQQQ